MNLLTVAAARRKGDTPLQKASRLAGARVRKAELLELQMISMRNNAIQRRRVARYWYRAYDLFQATVFTDPQQQLAEDEFLQCLIYMAHLVGKSAFKSKRYTDAALLLGDVVRYIQLYRIQIPRSQAHADPVDYQRLLTSAEKDLNVIKEFGTVTTRANRFLLARERLQQLSHERLSPGAKAHLQDIQDNKASAVSEMTELDKCLSAWTSGRNDVQCLNTLLELAVYALPGTLPKALCEFAVVMVKVDGIVRSHAQRMQTLIRRIQHMAVSDVLYTNRYAMDRLIEHEELETHIKLIKDARVHLADAQTMRILESQWPHMRTVAMVLQNVEASLICALMLATGDFHRAYAVAKLVCQRTVDQAHVDCPNAEAECMQRLNEWSRVVMGEINPTAADMRALCAFCSLKSSRIKAATFELPTASKKAASADALAVSYQTLGMQPGGAAAAPVASISVAAKVDRLREFYQRSPCMPPPITFAV